MCLYHEMAGMGKGDDTRTHIATDQIDQIDQTGQIGQTGQIDQIDPIDKIRLIDQTDYTYQIDQVDQTTPSNGLDLTVVSVSCLYEPRNGRNGGTYSISCMAVVE